MDLHRIILLDNPVGRTVTSNGATRPARPGEGYRFDALAVALFSSTGVPSVVSATLPEILDPGTVFIIPARQLRALLAELAARNTMAFMAVIDADRKAIPELLEIPNVVTVIEHHQYWAWQVSQRADASIFGNLSVVPRLHREVTIMPLIDGRFGRIRILGEDLPGLLGDYLAAVV